MWKARPNASGVWDLRNADGAPEGGCAVKIGLYVHIPFCASKCGYCDFYSVTDRAGRHAYADVLVQEILSWKGRGYAADTLFVGGGTPSLMEAGELLRILAACREAFSLDPEGEIALEANPDSVSLRYLEELRRGGFNRISFGAQSIEEAELRALGRRHDAAAIRRAMDWAGEAGFARRSLDIMLGIPYQTRESLSRTLEAFAAMGPDQLSAYLLKIEEGTPFARNGAARLCPDDDMAAELYLQTAERLEKLGYRQYEISNFAKPGGESRHNLKYWRCREYLGFGPAAHSYWNGRRFYHPRGLAEYLSSGGKNWQDDGPGGSPEERLMLGLRLAEGVALSRLGFPEGEEKRILRKAAPLRDAGLLEMEGDTLRLTPRGFLVSNGILAELL